jgi:DNA primase
VLRRHDLDTAEGRLAALDEAAPIVGAIKDRGLRQLYAVSLDRWLGMMDEGFVLDRVRAHGPSTPGSRRAGPDTVGGGNGHRRGPDGQPQRGAGQPVQGDPGRGEPGQDNGAAVKGERGGGRGAPEFRYDVGDPVIQLEREALKLAVQRPALCGPTFDALGAEFFTAPVHASVLGLIAQCGGASSAAGGREWAERLRAAAPDDRARGFVTRLAVEPLRAPRSDGEADARYADAVLARVEELSVSRDIAVIKSRLQRLSPVEETAAYNRMFGDLVALEQRRKVLSDRAAGAL